jgi:Fungal specific transcription factor domain
LTLRFRNETLATKGATYDHQSNKIQNESGDLKLVTQQISKLASTYLQTDALQMSIPQSMRRTVNDQALDYFVYHYVSVPRNTKIMGSYLECVLPLLTDSKPDSHLSEAVLSVAFAAFGRRHNNKVLVFKAREKYMKALKLTSSAVQNMVEARKNQTLLAILLLGLFEVS